jgi:hypothetical protein
MVERGEEGGAAPDLVGLRAADGDELEELGAVPAEVLEVGDQVVAGGSDRPVATERTVS